ncbi:MAG: phosphomannomutase/phosphoglucomutase [Porticoccaceae bacterium]
MISSKTSIRAFINAKPRLPRWCFGALLLMICGLVLGHIKLHNLLIDKPYQRAIQTQLAISSSTYLKEFNKLVADLIARADLLSRDPNTLKTLLLPENNPSAWVSNARVLDTPGARSAWLYDAKAKIREARHIYLVGNSKDVFPLEHNFVAENLYRIALNGDHPAPRASKLNEWSIYIARPIFAGGVVKNAKKPEVAGVLLLDIDPKALSAQITGSREIQGRLQLTQEVERFPAGSIFTLGSGQLDDHSISVPTIVPKWHLHFTGSRELLASIEPSKLWFYAAFTALCLMALAISYWLIRKNLFFIQTDSKKTRTLNPKDDLFTEKYQRNKQNRSPEEGIAAAKKPKQKPIKAAKETSSIPGHIFRDYDIRGKAETEISESFASLLGKALGSRQVSSGNNQLAICADGRNSSPALKKALAFGIISTGCNVIDIGEAPTPVLNFALATMNNCDSGIMVTASHNPRDDNGFKIIFANQAMSSSDIQALRTEMMAAKFAQGAGTIETLDVHQQYIKKIAEDVLPASGLNVVIDCGNGIAGTIAPDLFRLLDCTNITELFTKVDGNFPNHDPDPTVPANLDFLIDTIARTQADLGLAFDGDGDRLVAVTRSGRIVWPDELLMIFARDIVTRTPGADIIFDVKSTSRLRELIANYGGRPVMWKTGHAHIRNKVKESGAPLGGEFSGHIFFNDRWFGFDDGLYAAARLLEIITLREETLDDIVASFPESYSTPEIKIPVDEEDKKEIIRDLLLHQSAWDGAQVIAIDGLRVEYPEGWGLIRASNTTAALTLRFEADSPAALEAIIEKFKEHIQAASPDLPLDF